MATLTKYFAITGWEGLAPTIAASSEDSSFPATNLGSKRLSYCWRSVAGVVTGITLDITHSAAKTIGGIVLVGTNLSDTATIRAKLSLTALGNSDVLDSGVVNAFNLTVTTLQGYTPPWGRPVIITFAASVSARYIRLYIEDSANAYGYVGAAIALAEQWWQPAGGIAQGYSTADQLLGDPGVQVALRGYDLSFHNATTDERYKILALARYMKMNRRFMVVPHPLAPESFVHEAAWSRLDGLPVAVPLNGAATRHTIQIKTIEVDE